jgi:hypothetical protein
MGNLFDLCRDKDCKTHFNERSHYQTTPQEQAKRKKEREQDEAKRAKFDASIATALAKVKFPLSEKSLDALLDVVLSDKGTSFLMPICKRHDLKADKSKDGARDYHAPLLRLAEEGGSDGKLRMIFELHLPTYWAHTDDSNLKKRIAKL